MEEEIEYYNKGFCDGYEMGLKENERMHFLINDALRLQIEHLKLDLEDERAKLLEIEFDHKIELLQAYQRGLFDKKNA